MVHTGEGIQLLLNAEVLERIGLGQRRACYRLLNTGYCVKCYRSDAEIAEGKYPGRVPLVPLAPAVVSEISRRRFDERRNTCCEEFEYWKNFLRKLPADVAAIFPERVEKRLLPERGWCIVEELILNADGSLPVLFRAAYEAATEAGKADLIAAYDRLMDSMVRYAVKVYDPQNVMVQTLADGSYRLRIADFEPASRMFIPIDSMTPFLVRLKIRRRFLRFRGKVIAGIM